MHFLSEFKYDPDNEISLLKELVLQVRKVIGPFAAPKKVFIVADLPKTRSGKVCLIIECRCESHLRTDHAPHSAKDRRWRG